MTRKIRIDTSDPETKAIWNAALRAKQEVASWPAWKLGDARRDEASLRSALQRIHELLGPCSCPGWNETRECEGECAAQVAIVALSSETPRPCRGPACSCGACGKYDNECLGPVTPS